MGEINIFDLTEFVEKYGCKTYFETGTGEAVCLSHALKYDFEKFYTVDLDEELYEKAKNRFVGYPLTLINNYSSKALDEYVPKLDPNTPVFFFLDAHWQNDCPLIDELQAIGQSGKSGIIAIHDWKVPNSDLGFDSYNGQDFTYEWIEPTLQANFKQYKAWYNNPKTAIGARRGVLFIEF